ncbi:hypothetical protein [Embleya sp. NPDC059237]|uniref:hypothetical protein n=1 Tax=Embleya sp. NPDC059237 TaxID=3346784 RepID=UPI0036B99E36
MSSLPLVREGDIVEHAHEEQRNEFPAGRVTLTGVGMVTVEPLDGTPKWTVDRYDVRHIEEAARRSD